MYIDNQFIDSLPIVVTVVMLKLLLVGCQAAEEFSIVPTLRLGFQSPWDSKLHMLYNDISPNNLYRADSKAVGSYMTTVKTHKSTFQAKLKSAFPVEARKGWSSFVWISKIPCSHFFTGGFSSMERLVISLGFSLKSCDATD